MRLIFTILLFVFCSCSVVEKAADESSRSGDSILIDYDFKLSTYWPTTGQDTFTEDVITFHPPAFNSGENFVIQSLSLAESSNIKWTPYTARQGISTSDTDGRSFLALSKETAPDTSTYPIIIILTGESNAGGYANNGFLTGAEGATRNLKILHNGTYTFTNLHIGENNLIGHQGLSCCDTHGWELQLANSYDSGYFKQHPVYLVKAAQGGSQISQWETTDPYYDTLIFRTDTAVKLVRTLTGREPVVYIFDNIGINDMNASVPGATWQPLVEDFIDNYRADINTIMGYSVVAPVIITKFNMLDYLDYNDEIDNIAINLTDVTTVYDANAELRDGAHWQYEGMKSYGRLMIAIVLNYLFN